MVAVVVVDVLNVIVVVTVVFKVVVTVDGVVDVVTFTSAFTQLLALSLLPLALMAGA